MGDFERTFGAGADASSIIDSFSDQHGRFDSIDHSTLESVKITTPAERIERAKQLGANIYWRAPGEAYPDAVDPSIRIQPEYLAFDQSTKKNIGRIYRIDRHDNPPFISQITGRWEYPESWELWGWSMYAHGPTENLPFRTYGATNSGPEAEGFMIEAYGMLLEHNSRKPSFFTTLPLQGDGYIQAEVFDPGYAEVFIDAESARVVSARHCGYAVVRCSPDGNFGSVHFEIEHAIAAFSAEFDSSYENDVPTRRKYEPRLSRAISAMLTGNVSAETIQHGDANISIARVSITRN
jgi:hypothetical protein